MLLSLLKKDFLIAKKGVFITLAVSIIIPPYMVWRAPEYTGVSGFILSAVFCVYMLLQYVSLKEYRFPKAAAYLCTMPFPRKMMVLSKYVFCILGYVLCCIIFEIETLFIPKLGILDIKTVICTFFVTAAFIGVYLPLQYKLGYEKSRFVLMFVIMTSPVILPALVKMVNFNIISELSPFITYGGIFLIGSVILITSAFLSVSIYNKADLA